MHSVSIWDHGRGLWVEDIRRFEPEKRCSLPEEIPSDGNPRAILKSEIQKTLWSLGKSKKPAEITLHGGGHTWSFSERIA